MPTTHTVRIKDMMYRPEPITIQVGDSIVWENRDSVPHTATFDFDARRVATGAISDPPLAFPQPSGQSGFSYFCEFHPEMLGTVIVSPAADGGPPDVKPTAKQEYPPNPE